MDAGVKGGPTLTCGYWRWPRSSLHRCAPSFESLSRRTEIISRQTVCCFTCRIHFPTSNLWFSNKEIANRTISKDIFTNTDCSRSCKVQQNSWRADSSWCTAEGPRPVRTLHQASSAVCPIMLLFWVYSKGKRLQVGRRTYFQAFYCRLLIWKLLICVQQLKTNKLQAIHTMKYTHALCCFSM